jgi:phospholipase C
MRRLSLSVTILAALAACSSKGSQSNGVSSDAGADVDTRPPTPAEWDRPVTRPDDATANSKRGACGFAAGAMPAETLGTGTPVDKDIPIDTIVVITMENHSFDNYFGHLNKYAGRTDIESAPDTTSNMDKITGGTKTYPWQHAPHLCNMDTNHEWDGSHTEYDDGKNDGFGEANENWIDTKVPAGAPADALSGQRAMNWWDERDIPFHYELAKTFAIADHYHASVLGPTYPNRMFLYTGTSFGLTYNGYPDLSAYNPYPDSGKDVSIIDELERRHVSWMLYADGPPGLGVVYTATAVNRWSHIPNSGIADFKAAAAAGTLPQLSLVDPHLSSEGPTNDDEHPPSQIQIGQKFVADAIQAVMSGPQWAHVAIFLTWDEHGGYYDHVAPPAACAPDSHAIDYGTSTNKTAKFDRLGFRVPLIVVSPYAKKSYVGHHVYDHTSVTRFIEAKFKVPALTARDANAEPPMDLFDFSNPAFATPPTIAAPTINQTEVDYCKASFTP